jgi:hypothetical protein
MARVIPATLELLGANDLLGLILAGKGAEILDKLLRRLNYDYAIKSPALANICPLPGGFSNSSSSDCRWRSSPSADGRTYHSRWAIFSSSPAPQTADLDVQKATSYGGPWTSVGTYPQVGVAVAPGLNRYTYDAPLSGSTTYLRCIASNLSGPQPAQVHSFALAPKELTVIPSGVQPSGFVAYNDSALLVGSGDAPIHTESFDRAARGVRATARDLRQCVMSYVQSTTTPFYAFTATATQTLQRMALTPFHVPLTKPTDVTVYCRAEDTGSPDGIVRVGQLGSQYEPATFVADNTDQAVTLTLDHQAPSALYIDAIDPGTRLGIWYAMVEWRPEVGSTSPIIASISPPALREYLGALDYLTLDAVLADYAVTGLNFNGPDNAAALGLQYIGQQVQPGVSGMQLLAAVSRDGSGTAGAPVRVQTATSGAAAADTILVESPTGGAYVYPPGPLANVVYGSNAWIPTPSDPNGSFRLAELTKSRRPAWEEMWYDRAHAASGVPIRVEGVASLPTP